MFLYTVIHLNFYLDDFWNKRFLICFFTTAPISENNDDTVGVAVSEIMQFPFSVSSLIDRRVSEMWAHRMAGVNMCWMLWCKAIFPVWAMVLLV